MQLAKYVSAGWMNKNFKAKYQSATKVYTLQDCLKLCVIENINSFQHPNRESNITYIMLQYNLPVDFHMNNRSTANSEVGYNSKKRLTFFKIFSL